MQPLVGIPCGALESERALGSTLSAVPQSYLEALEASGAAPLLVPITGRESTLRALYRQIDALLLAGGADLDPARYGEQPHPALDRVDSRRDWVELTLTGWALADDMPLLGICRGIQTLNVACGGSLWQDISAQVPACVRHRSRPGEPYNRLSHTVQVEPGSRLARILGDPELEVNSLHHQGIRDVGAGLRVTARAPDGLVEGLERDGDGWVVAVQWHPEWLLEDEPRMKRLFEAFVQASSKSDLHGSPSRQSVGKVKRM